MLVPFRDRMTGLSRLSDWMDQMMERAGFPEGANPLDIDLVEDEQQFTVRTAIPGVDKDAIKISVSGNLLTISGESKNEYEDKDSNYYIHELSFGKFSRSIRLPAEVNADQAEAELADGVLTIRLPRVKPSPKKNIAVKAPKSDKIAVKAG